MSNIDLDSLRNSFKNQFGVLFNGDSDIQYLKVFLDDENLMEALFNEYCDLEHEPDHETYLNFRLKQEGNTICQQ